MRPTVLPNFLEQIRIGHNGSVRKWLISVGFIVLGLAVCGLILTVTVQTRAKRRLEKILADRFNSDVRIGSLSVTLVPFASVRVEDVELRYQRRTDIPPMIMIKRLLAQSDLPTLLLGAQHDVNVVRLEGLRINIARGMLRHEQFERKENDKRERGKNHLPFVVHHIIADGAVLTVIPKDRNKEPLEWDMAKLSLRSVGPDRPMEFVTTLTNAKPPGLIHSKGSFGPWQRDEPSDTPVSGNYTFSDADMGVFKGISGKLSSEGNYHGTLDSIDVEGTTDIPDFQIGKGSPVDLKTKFHATVDGTRGDTLLHPVDATFLQSRFICNGGVVGTPGIKGKKVTLDAVSKNAQMEDILLLVLNTKRPPLTGAVDFRSKIIIPQGDIPVIRKLILDGQFRLRSARFTSDDIQNKIDLYSGRSRGLDDKAAREDDVASNMQSKFVLKNAYARLSGLSFQVPGIFVRLDGSYGLESEQIDFRGVMELQGKLSQMSHGWRSWLLKAADPFFHKEGGGTMLPIMIDGTKSDPKFGVDFGTWKKKRKRFIPGVF